jgi:tRNA A-37 threonylcarbamoyl transferase component Bud32
MRSCPECAATYPDDYAICPKDGAPLQDTTLWQIGTVVRGKYLIQSRLGEGGMAIVYKAHHELLDESRALKVIRPDLARDAEFMTRFKNEAIMARKLNHPNAVRVDDLDIAEDGLPFIAMELVVGDTLKTLILQTGPLPATLVLSIALPVCEALDAAHKLGLIHRDIKPENIVLVAQREGPPVPKILDFGISRLKEETAQAKGLTQTGMVIGTPEYMSPEQVMGKKRIEIDGRSDLYSLGVVMYRMLTGELPFQGESTMEMILQHLKIPPRAPHQLKPGLAIPEAVSSIVMKALEKNRENRYATGAEMAAAIRKTLRKMEWASVKSAAAAVGAKSQPSSPGARTVAAPARPAPLGVAAPAPMVAEKPIYRSFARTDHRPKEFPTRWLLTLVAASVLMVSAFAVWKHFKPGPLASPAAGPPAGTAKSDPAKNNGLSPSGGQKTAETPTMGPASTAPNGQRPGERKKLTYDEQAKIVELNSLAAIYYREGGCGKALPIYEQVLEIDPHDPRAYDALRKCYSKARSGVPITPAPTTSPDTSPNP